MINMKTIQSRLFISYSLLIACIITAFISYYFIFNSDIVKKQALNSLANISDYIFLQTETELKNMDSTSQKILSSDIFENAFFNNTTNTASSFLNQKNIESIIYSIVGPDFTYYRINIFNLNNRYISLTTKMRSSAPNADKINNIPWLETTIEKSGVKYITTPHMDTITSNDKPVISLCRAFAEVYGMKTYNFIEIQQDYDVFRNYVEKALSQNTNINYKEINVYILNKEGQIIYPYKDSASSDNGTNRNEISRFYWDNINRYNKSSGTLVIRNEQNTNNDILAYNRSDFSGWTVITAESENSFLKPLYTFRNNTLLAGLVILFLTLIVSFFVARGLTSPIKRIHKLIRHLTLNTLPSQNTIEIKSSLNELEELNLSFNKMCERLTSSLDEVVSARTHEIQSRMLALQAQMNPHFLYNTLALISVMAEESGNANIVEVTEDFSKMIRYISSESVAPVKLESELQFLTSYLVLVKNRFSHKLAYEINIPESMYEIKIPKLSLQPIVENCIKYGMDVRPPWSVKVQGILLANSWQITIQDNGPGFSPEQLQLLKNKLEIAGTSNILPELNLNGMGLINIFIRLKHLFGDNAVFELGDSPYGGAVVTIGGPVF
jgi:two-component system, sensor histidine kinase YesM